MYIHMCMCVYMYIYVYIYTHVYIFIYGFHAPLHSALIIYVYIYCRVCTCARVCAVCSLALGDEGCGFQQVYAGHLLLGVGGYF